MSARDQDHRIIEYLYGELDPAERTAFEQALEADPSLRAELEGLKQTRGMMQHVVDEEPPQALFYDLVREARKSVAPETKPSLMQQFFAALIRPQAATAMLVLVVAGTGLYLLDNNQHRIQEHPGDVVSPNALPTKAEMAHVEVELEEAEPLVARVEVAKDSAAKVDDLSASFGADLPTMVAKGESEPAALLGSTAGTIDGMGKRSAAKVARNTTVSEEKTRSSRRRAKRTKSKRTRSVSKKGSSLLAGSNVSKDSSETLGYQGQGIGGGSLGVTAMQARSNFEKAGGRSPQIVYGAEKKQREKQVVSPARLAENAPPPMAEQSVGRTDTDKVVEEKPAGFERAMLDYKAKRYGQAVTGFKRVLADKGLGSRVYTARLHMARAYRKQGKLSLALGQYRQLLEMQQSGVQKASVLLETARLEMNMGQLGIARTHVMQLLKRRKKPLPAATDLLKQIEERIAAVEKAKKSTKKTPAKSAKPKK